MIRNLFTVFSLRDNLPRVFMPSGSVLQALQWGLHGQLLKIDVVDHLRHIARQTSLSHPQPETRRKIATQ